MDYMNGRDITRATMPVENMFPHAPEARSPSIILILSGWANFPLAHLGPEPDIAENINATKRQAR